MVSLAHPLPVLALSWSSRNLKHLTNIAALPLKPLFAPTCLRNVLRPKTSLRLRPQQFSTSSVTNASDQRHAQASRRKENNVKQTCESVTRKLHDGDPAKAAATVYRALDHPALDNPSRFNLYEHSIAAFLRYGEVMKAAMLYSRMTREGYIPSLSLRVQMHVVKLAELSVAEDVLFETISEAIKQDSYDEVALRDLLRMLVQGLQGSPEFIRKVVDAFTETRGPGYRLTVETTTYLMTVLQKGGDPEGARYWSTQPVAPAPADPEQQPANSPAAPYTTLLRDLAATKPTFEVYKWTLERMRADNVQPDMPFFNALLAYEAGRRNYEVVFAIYRMLLAKRTAAVKPSAHTFSTLFRVLHRLSCSHRYRRTHHIRMPPNAPTARAVYRDLLTCHLEHTGSYPNRPSPTLDAIALHKALRTLLAQRDYAAAYTALRAFRLFPAAVGAPTLATYRLVFGGLLGRIRAQFPALVARIASALAPESVWTFRFLGMQHLSPHERTALPLDLSVVHRVLLVGADPRVSLGFVPAPNYAKPESQSDLELYGLLEDDPEDERRRVERIADPSEFHPHGMPTPIELTGLKAASDTQTYKVAPLERVLKRAIAASLPLEDGSLSDRVSGAIEEAKKEMVVKS